MKFCILLLTAMALFSSCKKESEDTVIVDPMPTLTTFDGEMGRNDNSTTVSADDQLLICGNTPSGICLLKITKSGTLTWRKDNIGGWHTRAASVAQSNNEDIFICGTSFRNDMTSGADVLLIKTNPNGDTLWTKSYGSSHDDHGDYILHTDDGHLLVAGRTYSPGVNGLCHIYMLKLDIHGDTVWTRRFIKNTQQVPYHILELASGEFLVTGISEDTSSLRNMYFLNVSPDGLINWDRRISNPNRTAGLSTLELANGDLITCGKIYYPDDDQIVVLKTDALGNPLWSKEYGETFLTEQANSIQVNNDGTFVIVGGAEQPHTGQTSIVLLTTDQQGNQLVMKRIDGHSLFSYAQHIIKDHNDDNIITGNYHSNIFITRTDNRLVFK